MPNTPLNFINFDPIQNLPNQPSTFEQNFMGGGNSGIVQDQLQYVLKNYMQSMASAGNKNSALDLSSYTVNPSMGRMENGGIAVNPGGGDPPSIFGRRDGEPLTPAEEIVSDAGIDLDFYRRYRNLTGFHESAHTMDPKIRQKSNNSSGLGPGRGIFQFEPDSAKTAAGRLEKYYKQTDRDVPDWITEFSSQDSPDASELSAREQEVLLLGEMMYKTKGGKGVDFWGAFKDGATSDEDVAEVWFNHHNKSNPNVKDDRVKSFLDSAKLLGDNVYNINVFDRTQGDIMREREMRQRQEDSAAETQVLGEFFNQGISMPQDNTSVDTLRFADLMGGLDTPMFKEGGYIDPEKLFLGKMIKGIGKGIGNLAKGVADGALTLFGKGDVINNSVVDKSKFLSGAFNIGNNVLGGVGDFALSSLGMPNVINNTAVDNSGFLSGFSGMLGQVAPTALNMVVPGAGTALSLGAGALNNATYGKKDAGRKSGLGVFNTLGTLGNIAGMAIGASGGGLSEGIGKLGENLAGNSSFLTSMGNIGSNQTAMQGIGALLGMIGGDGSVGNTGVQGGVSSMMGFPQNFGGLSSINNSNYGANMFGNFGGLNFATPRGVFKNGGMVENVGITDILPEGLVAVQTEKYKGIAEKIIFPDGMISEVNAHTSHEKMDEDYVTDVIPVGSYVASARKETKLSYEDLKNINIGYENLSYEEHRKGTVPKLITAATILKKEKDIIPADYATLIQNKFKVEDKDDIFARATNAENINSRVPYLQALVSLGEEKRQQLSPDNVSQFRYGGEVKKMELGDIAGILGSALPFMGSLFGGTSGGVDRQSELLMNGALPLSTLGVTNNVNSQRSSLDNALSNLQGLTSDLQGFNNAGTAIGVGGQLMQDTDLPELNLDFSRLENFNTQTPQSIIDAAATPTIDATSVLDRLGSRGGASFLANSMGQQMNARNQAAAQAFGREQQMDYNIANALTQGYNQEEMANNGIRQQEINARNNVFNNIAGQMQGNLQNRGNILSNAFTTGSQLDLQRAQLDGQIPMYIAQQMMNAAGMRLANQGNADGSGRQGGIADMLGGLFGGGGGGPQTSTPIAMNPSDFNNFPAPTINPYTPSDLNVSGLDSSSLSQGIGLLSQFGF